MWSCRAIPARPQSSHRRRRPLRGEGQAAVPLAPSITIRFDILERRPASTRHSRARWRRRRDVDVRAARRWRRHAHALSVPSSRSRASRPADRPGSTRSRPAGERTLDAVDRALSMVGSAIQCDAAGSLYLALARLPAKAANRGDQPDRAPDEQHGRERASLRPDWWCAHHHVARQLGEVRERQHVGDRAQERAGTPSA